MVLGYRPLFKVATVSVLVFMAACSRSNGSGDETPADDQNQYVINSDNYVGLIAEVLDIYVGDVYNKPLLHGHDVLGAIAPATSTFDEDELVRRQTYDCVNGGSASSM